MPQLDGLFYTPYRPDEPPPPAQTQRFRESFPFQEAITNYLSALPPAFRVENDVIATWGALSQPQFAVDHSFDLIARLKESGYWESPYRNNFLGVSSEGEFANIARRIEEETKDREFLAAAGPAGFLAMMTAGVMSPVSLIPILGPGVRAGRVGRALLEGTALGAVAGGIQEAALFSAQQTRTPEEAYFGIGAAAVFGGLLGGAAGLIGRARLRRIEQELTFVPERTTVSPPVGTGERVRTLQLESGTFRFMQDGSPVEFTAQRVLVLTPDNLDLVAQHMGVEQVSWARLIKFAKDNGYDAVVRRGFDELPAGIQVTLANKQKLSLDAQGRMLAEGEDEAVRVIYITPEDAKKLGFVGDDGSTAVLGVVETSKGRRIGVPDPSNPGQVLRSVPIRKSAQEDSLPVQITPDGRATIINSPVQKVQIVRPQGVVDGYDILNKDAVKPIVGQTEDALPDEPVFRATGTQDIVYSPNDAMVTVETMPDGRVIETWGSQGRIINKEDSDISPFQADLFNARTAIDAVKAVLKHTTNPFYKVLGKLLLERMPKDTAFRVALVKGPNNDPVVYKEIAHMTRGNVAATHFTARGDRSNYIIHLNTEYALSETTVIHEAIHGVTAPALFTGKLSKASQAHQAFTKRMEELHKQVAPKMQIQAMNVRSQADHDFQRGAITKDEYDIEYNHASRLDYGATNVHELLAVGLAETRVQNFLRTLDYTTKSNFVSSFVEAVREILGLPRKWSTALEELVFNLDALSQVNPEGQALRRDIVTFDERPSLNLDVATAGGRLKQGIGFNFLAHVAGPVSRALQQVESVVGREIMGKLSNAGLQIEGGGAVGGTAESRSLTYYGHYWQVIDELDVQYTKYFFGSTDDAAKFRELPTQRQRAFLEGFLKRNPNKLSKSEFRNEVSRALRRGDNHEIPEVTAVAQVARKKFFDRIMAEAQSLEKPIFPEELKVVGDESYLNRIYDNLKIESDPNGFEEILWTNFNQKLQADFAQRLDKLREQKAAGAQQIEDLNLSMDEVQQVRQSLLEEIKKLDEERSPELVRLEENIAAARAASRGDDITEAEREALLARAKELEEQGGEALRALTKGRAARRRRISRLNRNRYVLGEKYAKKMDKIERAEELQLQTLHRLIAFARPRLDEIDELTDPALRATEERELIAMIQDTMRKIFNAERWVRRTMKEDEEIPLPTQYYESKLLEQSEDLMRRFEDLDFNTWRRDVIADELRDTVDELVRHAADITNRRALRTERMRQDAQKFDPRMADVEAERIRLRQETRQEKFLARLQEQGAENIDLDAGTASFEKYARANAEETRKKIQGIFGRLPGYDIIRMERGPELARTLDISSDYVSPGGRKLEDFLENDVEVLLRAYVRTMAGDIEIARKFGSVDGREGLDRLVQEQQLKIKQVDEQLAAKTITQKARDQRVNQINKRYHRLQRDIEAVISRIRHTFGVPTNPYSMGERLARVALNINVLRYMGNVTPSSFPDVARPIMKFGVSRAFGDGYFRLVQNLKSTGMATRESRLSGGALDPITHGRAQQLSDLLENTYRGSRFEKGLEFAAQHMGVVALFDYWTSAMKQITGGIVINKFLDDIDMVINGTGTADEIAKATEWLAQNGIDGDLAARIWAEVTNGKGGAKVNGTWMPNTEDWVDLEAQRAFRQVIVRQINDTIVTPGVERPLMSNSTTLGRLLFQFKSFMLSSTTKTLMAGMQQRDANFMIGFLTSLALGTVSFYVSAVTIGGQTFEDMMNLDAAAWLDEAIDRSGVLGILGELPHTGSKFAPFTQGTIPFTDIPRHYLAGKFSPSRSTRREGADFMDELGGPSFDLIRRSLGAAGDAGDLFLGLGEEKPTQGDLHRARTILPFQNVFYLRQLLNQVERGAGSAWGLPERRE